MSHGKSQATALNDLRFEQSKSSSRTYLLSGGAMPGAPVASSISAKSAEAVDPNSFEAVCARLRRIARANR